MPTTTFNYSITIVTKPKQPEILTGRGVPDQHPVVEEPDEAKVCAMSRTEGIVT